MNIMYVITQYIKNNHHSKLAIVRLLEAITLYPGDENNYLDLATICIDHNAFPLGIEIVQLGLKSRPGSEKLLFHLGVLHALSGEFDLARDDFRRAGELDPGKDLPLAALELADIQQNSHDDILQELRRNLKQKGNSAVL